MSGLLLFSKMRKLVFQLFSLLGNSLFEGFGPFFPHLLPRLFCHLLLLCYIKVPDHVTLDDRSSGLDQIPLMHVHSERFVTLPKLLLLRLYLLVVTEGMYLLNYNRRFLSSSRKITSHQPDLENPYVFSTSRDEEKIKLVNSLA